jgi:hypothetical protein
LRWKSVWIPSTSFTFLFMHNSTSFHNDFGTWITAFLGS